MLSDAAFACVRVRAILTHFSGERPGTQGLPRRPPVIHRNSGDPQRSSFGRFRIGLAYSYGRLIFMCQMARSNVVPVRATKSAYY